MNGDREAERLVLLDEIDDELRDTSYLTGCSSLALRVKEALRSVPRHAFVPDPLQGAAYRNAPLPIGHSQTISQPYIVALMTELIDPEGDDTVLEIGTGSGYQAAVLGRLVKQVYTLEIVDELAQQARERLWRLGFGNVFVRQGDGNQGWPEHAPYDAIVVTAAAQAIPPALVDQLKPGGTLVIPVGAHHFGQNLKVIRKDAAGHLLEHSVLPVVFVPLTGKSSTQ